MTLEVGSVVGSYEVVRYIASGGMGSVFEGRHVALGRRVALKVASPELARDSEAVRRFHREARAASELKHPNICSVYDFYSLEDVHLLVLEYLEGETLQDRLRRERCSTDDLYRIGAELADALDHAHRRKLVHRDLKPSNVMLTSSGAMVLDFGAVRRTPDTPSDEADGRSSELTRSLTKEGQLVGTLPYMAPEQLDGSAVDHRTDIHALGLMLYEMATARHPYDARSPGAIAASILKTRPVPITSLNDEIPQHLARIIERCIDKDPDDRWQSARDLAEELRWAAESGRVAETAVREARLESRRANRLSLAAIGAALLATLALLLNWMAPSAPERGAARPLTLDLLPPPGMTLTEQIGALSPDGLRLAFAATDAEGRISIWLRDLARSTVSEVPGSTGGLKPFWSPDSERLGFFADSELRVVELSTGRLERLATTSPDARGGSWGSDGQILFSPDLRGGLFLVAAEGGDARPATSLNTTRNEDGHLWPSFLPDGEHYLAFVASPDSAVEGLYVGRIDTGLERRLLPASASGQFSDGHVLFERRGALMAQPFDVASRELRGLARIVVPEVGVNFQRRTLFSATASGPLAHAGVQGGDATQLVLTSPEGTRSSTIGPVRHQRNIDVSPDGQRVAVEVYDGSQSDIWIMELATGRSRLLDDAGYLSSLPTWSHDGSTLAYSALVSGLSSLFTMDVNRADPPTLVHQSAGYKIPVDWTRDGTSLLFAERDEAGDFDVHAIAPDGRGDPTALLDSRHSEIAARLSPSGGRIAYVTDEAGPYQLYVETYPRTGSRCQLSVGSGYQPSWGETDATLYYLEGNGDLWSVRIDDVATCSVSTPTRLFATSIANPTQARSHYGYVRGLGLFLFNAPAETEGRRAISLLTDWRVDDASGVP